VTDPHRLAALARIAAIRKESGVAAFAAARRQAGAIEARIEALDTTLAEARRATAAGADPATLAAQDAFGRWSGGQRLVLAERLREAERLAGARRDAARLAFGRAEVLERLTREAAEERRGVGRDPDALPPDFPRPLIAPGSPGRTSAPDTDPGCSPVNCPGGRCR